MTGKSVRNFVDSFAKFDLMDPFGIGRLRNLAYEYKMQELNLGSEIERLRAINEEQAKAVTLMVRKLGEEESHSLANHLEIELQRSTDTVKALQEYAEQLELQLNAEKEKNSELKFRYDSAVALLNAVKPKIPNPLEDDCEVQHAITA